MRKYNIKFIFPLKFSLLWISTIAVLIFFLYHRTLYMYLVADDYEWWRVVRNLDIINSLRLFIPAFGWIEYRPVVGWILWFNTVIFSMSPLSFHLTSLFFHYIDTLLVGVVAWYSFRKRRAAFLTSLFFAVFPFHAEAVNYIMYNPVMMMFFLLSLISTMRYSRKRSVVWAGIACLTYLLGLFSLESAVTLPIGAFLFLFIIKRIPLRTIYRQNRYFLITLIFIFLVYFISRIIISHKINPYSFTGYMNESFAINNVFWLYLGICTSLVFLRFCARNIFQFFIIKERIFWFYILLIGVLFLPTFYIPTQERHLYLSSFAFVLAACCVVMSLDERLSKKSKFMRSTLWAGIVCMVILSGLFLLQSNERWLRASTITEKISSDIATIIKKNEREKKFYFLNFPDSLDGVYIYRVRMREAIEFKLGHDVTQELIFTPEIIGIRSSITVINKNSLLLKSEDGFMLFLPQKNREGKYIIKSNEYLVTQLDENTLSADFLESDFDIGRSNIFVFQNGNVQYKPFAK